MSQATRRDFSKDVEDAKRKKFPTMKLSEAINLIFSFPRDVSVVIYGEPGIGKTTVMLEKAKEEAAKLGKKLVDTSLFTPMRIEWVEETIKEIIRNPSEYYVLSYIKLGAAQPEDLLPYPYIIKAESGNAKAVTELTVLKPALLLPTYPGIYGLIFVDEVTNISDMHKKDFIAGLFGERKVGGTGGLTLSENVRVVGAGNMPEHSSLAQPLPEIVVGRAWQMIVEPDDLVTWYHVMREKYGDAVNPVYVFLHQNPYFAQNIELLEEVPRVGPTYRSWTMLIRLIANNREKFEKDVAERNVNALTSLAAGCVGRVVAPYFVAFLLKRTPSVEEVMANPKLFDEVVKDLDTMLSFSLHVTQRLEKALNKPSAQQGAEVVVKLDKHQVTLHTDDPTLYLVALAEVMKRGTSDVAAFVFKSMSAEARSKLSSLVSSHLVPPKKDQGTAKGVWLSKVHEAAKTIANAMISQGIAKFMLESNA